MTHGKEDDVGYTFPVKSMVGAEGVFSGARLANC